MDLFDIDRFKENNPICRRDEGCKRDGLIHRLYKRDMAALSPPSGWRSQGGRRLTLRTTKRTMKERLGYLTDFARSRFLEMIRFDFKNDSIPGLSGGLPILAAPLKHVANATA